MCVRVRCVFMGVLYFGCYRNACNVSIGHMQRICPKQPSTSIACVGVELSNASDFISNCMRACVRVSLCYSGLYPSSEVK